MRHSYKPGDWFVIPLRDTSYALGRIARANRRRGILLGYFFGPKLRILPSLHNTENLKREDADFVGFFGESGLVEGRWINLGHQASRWATADWPVPPFGYKDPLTGKYWCRIYPENAGELWERQYQIREEDFQVLPSDGLFGSEAVEKTLEEILDLQE